MANDLKIGIVVNANGAIQKIDEFAKKIKYSSETQAQYEKQLILTNEAVEKARRWHQKSSDLVAKQTKMTEQYVTRLNLEYEAMIQLGAGLKDVEKFYNRLSSAQEKFLSFGDKNTAGKVQSVMDQTKQTYDAIKAQVSEQERQKELEERQEELVRQELEDRRQELQVLQEQYENSESWGNKIASLRQSELKVSQQQRIADGDILSVYKERAAALEQEMNIAIEEEKRKIAWGQASEGDDDKARIYYQERINSELEEGTRLQEEYNQAQIIAKNNADYELTLATLTKDQIALKRIELTKAEKYAVKMANDFGTESAQATKAAQRVRDLRLELEKANKVPFSKKLLEIAKNIMGFQLVIATVRKGMTAIQKLFSDSANYAAEAEQVYSKLGTVFDDFATSASKASSTLAKNIGVATTTASSALSTVGDLLQAQGMGVAESLQTATEWVQQFQDIIAFKDINMSLEEFAQNFMSGAAGNLRNFRTFGSIVKESAVEAELASQGLDRLTGSELELAKMTTRAKMALKQQENAMNATTREWDTMLSINRRLNEEQKRLEENTGTVINNFFKPVKKWWTEILKSTNDALDAARKYNEKYVNNKSSTTPSGNKTPGLSSTQKSFATEAASVWRDTNDWLNNKDTPNEEARRVYGWMDSYGLSIEQAIEALNSYSITQRLVTEENIIYWKSLAEKTKAEEEATKALEQLKASMQTSSDAYGRFLENLRAVSGVDRTTGTDIDSSKYINSDYGKSLLVQSIQEEGASAVQSALTQIISGGNLEELAARFGKEIEYAIGEYTDKDAIQSQIDALKSIYAIANNQFIQTDGIDSNEQSILNQIIAKVVELNTTLENLGKTPALTAESARSSLNATMGANAAFYGKTLESSVGSYGLTDLIKDQMADLVKQYTATYAAAQSYAEGSPEREAEEKVLAEIIESYGKLNVQLTDAEKAQKELTEAEKKAKELEEQRKEWLESLNPFQEYTDAYKNGQTMFADTGMDSTQAGIVAVLAEILKQTEVFSELSSFFTDYIVPVVDAFLKPLLPVIEVIGKQTQTLVEALLIPMFPIIKIIAEALVLLMTPARIIAAVVKNIYVAVNNIFQRLIHPITGGNQMQYESISGILNEQIEYLKKIHNMTWQIEENTEGNDDKLDAYNEMLNKGMINEAEWASLVNSLNGVRSDRVQSWENGTYYNGANGTTVVYSGGINFTVNGTNLSAEEIFQEFQNWLAKQQRGGAQLTA